MFQNEKIGIGTKIWHSRLLTKLVCCLIVGTACYVPLAGHEMRPVTNLEMMSEVVESVVQTPLGQIQTDTTRKALIEMAADDPVMQFLNMNIVQAFNDAGWHVFIQSDSLFRGVKVFWHPLEVSVRYPERLHSGLFRSSRIVRKASCKLFMEAVSMPQGKVLWTGSLSAQREDTVAASALSKIEQNGLMFGHPAVPGATGFFKFLEPLAMLTGVAVLGYLFYAIRS